VEVWTLKIGISRILEESPRTFVLDMEFPNIVTPSNQIAPACFL
jgi:hypothetical protein